MGMPNDLIRLIREWLVERKFYIHSFKSYTRDGWKMWGEENFWRNKVKGEINEHYFYQTLSIHNDISAITSFIFSHSLSTPIRANFHLRQSVPSWHVLLNRFHFFLKLLLLQSQLNLLSDATRNFQYKNSFRHLKLKRKIKCMIDGIHIALFKPT